MRVIDQSEADQIAERHRERFVVNGDHSAIARFEKASLTGIRLGSLTKATFFNCYLDQVVFTGSNLEESAFDRCTLKACDLSQLPAGRLYAEKSVFTNCQFNGSYLSRAHLKAAQFESCDFTGTTLHNVFAVGASFRGSLLDQADFELAWLDSADLRQATFHRTSLRRAHLSSAFLSGLDLSEVNFAEADLRSADMSSSVLRKANLAGADLRRAKLIGSQLQEADLSHSSLANADFTGADLTGARIYGIAAWDLATDEKTKQRNLIITPQDAPLMYVDDIEVAQFIYLLLNRTKLRRVIDTITSSAVLILGRFTPERKAVLDAIGDELRKYNFLPIMFDFERSKARDFTETIKTLAGMSLFVIVDVTNPKSAPLELQATVPDYQIPFVPIIQKGEKPFSMFSDLKGKYDWLLDPLEYPSAEKLMSVFKRAIIDRAWHKHKELLERKSEREKVLSVDEFLENRRS